MISVPECGIDGQAELLAVGPCPPIRPGHGPIVTGTFRHASAQIVDVRVTGLDEPIGATGNHPFWSADRQQFVRADELRHGERVRTAQGVTEIVAVESRAEPAPVYNLEVQGTHVYQVAANGVLVHNGVACSTSVLGHYPEYVVKAQEIGAHYFHVPTRIWNRMSGVEKWAANQKFLNRMIARGDDIILATPAQAARTGTFFEKELNYLKSMGYFPSESGLGLIR